jgi:hypothetical protein
MPARQRVWIRIYFWFIIRFCVWRQLRIEFWKQFRIIIRKPLGEFQRLWQSLRQFR